MASTSSNISRFRPGIVLITGGAALFGIYCIYSAHQQHQQAPSLQRRNAVHRRRRQENTTDNTQTASLDSDIVAANDGNVELRDDTETIAGTEASQQGQGEAAQAGLGRQKQEDAPNLKQLLYYIAEEQCRLDAYIHHGVSCNACQTRPIRGIRWRCMNCSDYDLCGECKAASLHPKTHIFYEIRIPAPFLGTPQQIQPVVYPGRPEVFPRSLPHWLRKEFMGQTSFEPHELDALYDQFVCLADEVPAGDDQTGFGGSISRAAFDRTFVPLTSISTPRPNLIYDRMFSFYDTNADGFISLNEFVLGMAVVHGKYRRSDRDKLRAVFDGYDVDCDGHVSRKDFLRMFKAFYALQKEITLDIVAHEENEERLPRTDNVISSSQPLSAAFNHRIPDEGPSSTELKNPDQFGDMRSASRPIRTNSDDVAERHEILGDLWELQYNISEHGLRGTQDPQLGFQDAAEALRERWRRRQFYLDSDEGALILSPSLDDDGTSVLTPSHDSVLSQANLGSDAYRFPSVQSEDSGDPYRFPEVDDDHGKEILYHVTQQGINEILDVVFKPIEDLHVEVEGSVEERKKWRVEIEEWKRTNQQFHNDPKSLIPELSSAPSVDSKTIEADLHEALERDLYVTNQLINDIEETVRQQSVDDLLDQLGATVNGDYIDSEHDNHPPFQGIGLNDNRDSEGTNEEIQGNGVAQTSSEPHLDPTMPQNRPNSLESLHVLAEEDIQHRSAKSEPGHSPDNPGIKESKSNDVTSKETKDAEFGAKFESKPSTEHLQRLAMLDAVQQSIRRAGGPGKMSFPEFKATMNSDNGRGLAVLKSWFELGSF